MMWCLNFEFGISIDYDILTQSQEKLIMGKDESQNGHKCGLNLGI